MNNTCLMPFLLDFQFRRRDDRQIGAGGRRRQVDRADAPPAMAQRAARYLTARRNIAEEFDLPRVRRLVRVEFLESSLDIVNHGAQRDHPQEAGPAIRVKIPNRRADLIVRESGDVFHQKVYEPRIALQRLEQLQCAVARLHLGAVVDQVDDANPIAWVDGSGGTEGISSGGTCLEYSPPGYSSTPPPGRSG